MISTAQLQFLENEAETVDVVTAVGYRRLHLLGRHVLHGAGWLFQDGMGIGISEAEVDNLGIMAVMGHHDVRRLQVAVGYLLRMDIRQGLCYLEGNLTAFLLGGIGGKVLLQRYAVNPLGDQTGHFTMVGHHDIFQSDHLKHRRVEQRHENLKLLAQHLLIDCLTAILWLEVFQEEPTTIALGLQQTAIASRGQLLEFGELVVDAFVLADHIGRSRRVAADCHDDYRITSYEMPPFLPHTYPTGGRSP